MYFHGYFWIEYLKHLNTVQERACNEAFFDSKNLAKGYSTESKTNSDVSAIQSIEHAAKPVKIEESKNQKKAKLDRKKSAEEETKASSDAKPSVTASTPQKKEPLLDKSQKVELWKEEPGDKH